MGLLQGRKLPYTGPGIRLAAFLAEPMMAAAR